MTFSPFGSEALGAHELLAEFQTVPHSRAIWRYKALPSFSPS